MTEPPGARAPSEPDPPGEGPPGGAGLRVMTANLRNGKADAEALVELLHRADPDIVAFQELSPWQARRVGQAVGHRYAGGALGPRPDRWGMGLLMRHPGSLRLLPLPGRDAWIGRMPLPGRTDGAAVEAINVHLTPPHRPSLPWRMLRERRVQVRRLVEYMDEARRDEAAGGPPVFRMLLGDFNSTPWFPAYRALARGMVDVEAEVARREGRRPRATWAPLALTRPVARLDHVLADGPVRAASVESFPVPGSDHAVLVVELGQDRHQPVVPTGCGR